MGSPHQPCGPIQSPRARRLAARSAADNLVAKLTAKIGMLETTIEVLTDRLALLLHHRQDPAIVDRAPFLNETLKYVARGVRPPHAAALQRNVAAHVPDRLLGGRALQTLSPKELRQVQRGTPLPQARPISLWSALQGEDQQKADGTPLITTSEDKLENDAVTAQAELQRESGDALVSVNYPGGDAPRSHSDLLPEVERRVPAPPLADARRVLAEPLPAEAEGHRPMAPPTSCSRSDLLPEVACRVPAPLPAEAHRARRVLAKPLPAEADGHRPTGLPTSSSPPSSASCFRSSACACRHKTCGACNSRRFAGYSAAR